MISSRLADGIAVGAFVAAVGLGIGLIAFDSRSSADEPTRVEIRIRYSRFEPSAVVVPDGRPITFVLVNDDPIEHEWMIGDAAMHLAHRTGTEPYHASRPTEVSIPALATVETTVTFEQPVRWQYICHLPGHEAFGMVGVLEAR